jgi:hypothetical protein
MHRVPAFIGIVVIVLIAGLGWFRLQDSVRHGKIWHTIAQAARQDTEGARTFDPSMIAHLPEPARRYFGFVFDEGAALPSGAVLEMKGFLKLDGAPMAMQADQILAPPHGFVWTLKAKTDLLSISGADGLAGDTSWSRFWALGLLPVARAGSSIDHWRAAYGRMVAEAAFWSPAFLLPRENVEWIACGEDCARATVTLHSVPQAVDIFLHRDGTPVRVEITRWSDSNPDKTFRLQPFGGYLSDFRTIGGVRVPFRVEGGNFIGTPAYDAFYDVGVTSIDFIGSTDDSDSHLRTDQFAGG